MDETAALKLDDLTPEPWVYNDGVIEDQYRRTIFRCGEYCEFWKEADAAFVVLARRAFGIMLRRGWDPNRRDDGKWTVSSGSTLLAYWNKCWHADPFTALVRAEEWYLAKWRNTMSDKKLECVKKKRQHWYRQYIGECPVCGNDKSYRVRIYSRPPKDRRKRYVKLSEQETYDHCLER